MRQEPRKGAGMANDESGYIMVMSIFVMIIMVIVGIVLIVVGMGELELSSRTNVMEKVYDIAEAGVSRGVLQARYDPDLVKEGEGYGHVYPYGSFLDPLGTQRPQWKMEAPAPFGGGTYTVEIWQDERHWFPNDEDPNYKVIKSTGFYQKGSSSKYSASRTVEARVRIDAWSEDYDAAFDYIIFNNDTSPGIISSSWADPWPGSTFYLGEFVWDAITPYQSGQEVHAPKGAIYTKGNMDLSTVLGGKLEIRGNVVATGDILLSNTFDLNGGIDIRGNVVAGADSDWLDAAASTADFMSGGGNTLGAGDLDLRIRADVSGNTDGIRVRGLLAAARDVRIWSTASWGLRTAVSVNGVRAGRDVTIGGTSNLNLVTPVEVGKATGIYCGRDLSSESTFVGGLDLGDVWTGRNVSCATSWAGDKIGWIRANSGVTLSTTSFGTLRTGAIEAGSGGVQFNKTGSIISGIEMETGSRSDPAFEQGRPYSIKSVGNVNLSLSGFSLGSFNYISLGSIISKGDISLDAQVGGSLSYLDLKKSVKAWGSVLLRSKQNVAVGADVGRSVVSRNSSVSILSTGTIPGNITMSGGILAGGDLSVSNGSWWTWTRLRNVEALGSISIYAESMLEVNGAVRALGNASIDARGYMSTNSIRKGIWANDVNVALEQSWLSYRPRMYIDHIRDQNDNRTGDCIKAQGNITLRPNPIGGYIIRHGIYMGSNTDRPPANPGWVTRQTGRSYSASPDRNVHYGDGYGSREGNVTAAPVDNPAGGTPLIVPDVTAPAAPTRGTSTKETTYDIDVPGAADLTGTAVFPQPNWGYFQTQASIDHAATPGVAHILKDTGNVADGDYDNAAGNGQILFRWDSSTHYGNKETVYNGNANVVLKIQALDWTGKALDWEGTIVSKGNILIDNATSNWFVDYGNTLNIITGGGFFWAKPGLALRLRNNSKLHIYASREIDMSQATLAGLNQTELLGSFTAGWYVKFFSYSLYDEITWRWSRFNLDVEAWMPQYRVLSYREVERPARVWP